MAEQEGTMSKYVLRLTDALIKQAAPKEKYINYPMVLVCTSK